MKRTCKDNCFSAIRIEGAILPPEFLQKIAALEAPKQSGSEYGISKSLNLKDEIGRYWRIALDLWTDYRDRKGLVKTQHLIGINQWLLPFLTQVLGYQEIAQSQTIHLGERQFPIHNLAGNRAIPLVLTTKSFDLDKSDQKFGDEGRQRPPHGLLQEFLNAEDACLWGIVANGLTIRLLRGNPSLTRPAYIEADLERMFEEQIYSDFAAFWLIFHASRITPHEKGKPSQCILESWRKEAHETGERALANLRQGVTEALRQLGNGFLQHRKNTDLQQALHDGSLNPHAFFQELLRLVYRLLFLFKVEERGLLHDPQAPASAQLLYVQGYSLARIRDKALKKRNYDQHTDLWQGLLVTFRGLAKGAKPLGLPALGGLFDAGKCPHLDHAEIANTFLLEAIRVLSFFRSGPILARINYRDMGTEELGSVYESLLELHPKIDVEASPWAFGFTGDGEQEKSKGSERKLTGSYYTPPSLVNELIKSALEPVMEKAVKDHPEDPRGGLLKLKICDPACGSGHFLLAAARRMAAEISRLDTGSDTPEEMSRQHALRRVVQRCIYGVDKNPLSVELCKTALWIETVEPGKPLSFLDHRIQCGDSLVGATPALIEAGIPDEAFKPVTGDDKQVCSVLKKRNKLQRENKMASLFGEDDLHPWEQVGNFATAMVNLVSIPGDTLEEVEEKKRCYEQHVRSSGYLSGQFLADTWCASFMIKKDDPIAPAITEEPFQRIRRNPHDVSLKLKEEIQRLARQYRFFHWHLAFPDVFRVPGTRETPENETMGWSGGFDVLLGNPPWERIKLQEQEFFAARSPEIAKAPNAAARRKLIKALSQPYGGTENGTVTKGLSQSYDLFQAFQDAKREAEAVSQFTRLGGRFSLTGVGDVNTYALFAELFLNLISPKGRSGIIVPTGIATDNSTKAYFEEVSIKGRLASFYDFENREAIFPGVHRSYKFALLTLGNNIPETQYVFFVTQANQLKEKERQFTLSEEDIRIINPNTRTCPVFRSHVDAELTKKIHRNVPVLIDDAKGNKGNPWGIKFKAMFHMSNDSGMFRTFKQLTEMEAVLDGGEWLDQAGDVWVPLYEAKMVHQFDHRWATYEENGEDSRNVALDEKGIQNYQPRPRYWVLQNEVENRLVKYDLDGNIIWEWKRDWFMGWRDITNSTNERTVIAGVIPRVGVGDPFLLMFPDVDNLQQTICLYAEQNRLVHDFVTRQKISGTHLKYNMKKQTTSLPPSAYGVEQQSFITPRVLELTYTAHDLKPFAEDLGYDGPPFKWNPERRAILRAELDAYYAKLYGLTRDELRYILDPADVMGDDYPSETFRVLKKREIKEYGEYRTQRLVLEAWDKLAQNDWKES